MFQVDLNSAERTMDVRWADERRHVKKRRLARRLRESCRDSPRLHCRLLVWLGQHLVVWGSRLQERYSVAAGVPVSQSAQHATG